MPHEIANVTSAFVPPAQPAVPHKGFLFLHVEFDSAGGHTDPRWVSCPNRSRLIGMNGSKKAEQVSTTLTQQTPLA